jgi:fibronectin type 3 domain-containing protein
MKTFNLLAAAILICSCTIPADLGERKNQDIPVPDAVTVQAVSLNSVTIWWKPVSDAASYSVFRSITGEDDSFTRVKVTQETSWTDSSLTPGKVYYYQVSAALNNAGEGERSAAVSVCPMLPPAPENVRSQALAAGGIVINWDASASAVSYRIYRADSANGDYTILAEIQNDNPSYTDADVMAGNGYYYKITGINDLGEGELSLSTFSVMPLLSAPWNVMAQTISASSIVISWDGSAEASSYKVYRTNSAGGTYTVLAEVPNVNLSYTDSSVTVGNEYYYKVAGVNRFGEGVLSSYTFAATTLPPVPVGVTGTALSENQITLSWNAVSGALTYRLYRAGDSDGQFTLLAIVTAPDTVYIDSSLNPAAEYFYRVSAVNGIGESGQSAAISAVTKIPPPAAISAVPASASSIAVTWGQVSGALNYKLYRSTDENGPYEYFATTAELSYIDAVSDNTLKYFYKVSAVNTTGESLLSVYASAEFKFPNAPSGLSAVSLSSTSLEISWDSVQGASGYKLYHSNTTATGTYNLIATLDAASYTHTGLTINTDYWYKVSAVNIIGEGAQSAYITARIAPPATPANVRVTPLSDTSLRVSWDPVPGALVYSVYRSPDGDYVSASYMITSTTDTYYIDTGRDPFRWYYYRVSATNEIGTGVLTATAVYAYTRPIPLEEGVWYSRTTYASYRNGYEYYSFPVSGGNYFIQWGNIGHTQESNTNNQVSAYWSSTNISTNLSTSYFINQTGGLANPRRVQPPNSGYIIIEIRHNSNYSYDLRFYRE